MIPVAVLVFASYLAYEIFLESRIGKAWVRKSINVVFTLAVIPITLSLLIPTLQFERIKKEQQFQARLISAIQDTQLTEAEFDQFVQDQYRNIFYRTKKQAALFAEELLATHRKDPNRLTLLYSGDVKIRKKYRTRWQPFLQNILSEFDAIADTMSKNERRVSVKVDNGFPLLQPASTKKRAYGQIRQLVLLNGDSVIAEWQPGTFEAGEFVDRGGLTFRHETNDRKRYIFQIMFLKESTAFHSNDARYQEFAFRAEGNPLKEDQVRENASSAIRQLITTAYLMASTEKGDARSEKVGK